jgi:ATP-dependent DNA helicase RecQ
MRDQVSNLRSFGINCADYAASDVPTAQKDQNLRDFLEGKLSLIYVSPERIQIRSFLQNMHARAPTLNISLVAIDEAHCISEWGHDFRPSYLRVPRFVTETLKSGDSRPPILAITATASPPVLRDVRTILGIDDPQDVLEAESLDRRNLSFSVHFCPTDGSRAERLPEVLREIVPRVLKKQPFELFGRADDYRDAGVVFAVYANPHGRTTYRDGVGAIWDNLTQAGVVEPELAKLHSSGVPEKCPDCGQYTFRSVPANSSDEDQGRYLCEMCGHQFDRADRLQDREWDELVRGNQDSFKRNWFPLMVATKGYGMGVDKRNIRYIVHQGFSSSLEAYYQEAGRAGRDDEHAHCAIVCHPAHIDCERVHLNRLGPRDESPYPKCCEGKDLNRRTCPYGLPELCDFGAQANFLRHSYPKVETVLAKVMEIWDALMKKPSREVQIPHGNSEEEKNANERALYRLWTLGLIDDYTIDYSGGLSNSKMVVELTRFVGVVGSSPLSR